jgi:hypothetical protein
VSKQYPAAGYRWVVATNVLELDSPTFWHSHFIESRTAGDTEEATLGTRVVREYAGHIIVIDSFPVLNEESSQWHFYGWVLSGEANPVFDYNQIALNIEVLTASEPPALYKIYDLNRTTLPVALIEKGFSDEEEENDYAFLVLIEGHSRATLLKSLCGELEKTQPGFSIERVREDSDSLDLFGSSANGSWTLSTKVSRVKGTYETRFKLWRENASSQQTSTRNNPSIVSEEEQYFVGDSSQGALLKICVKHLVESVQLYGEMPID